jgi:SAM-dependent methyltransferase
MKLPSLKLSKKKHLPILVLFGCEYYPWQMMSLLRAMSGNVADWDLIHTNLFGYEIALLRHRYNMTMGEINLWEDTYAPILLKEKTVLDVGAGMGESAAFFFSKGAKKVVAIEPNRQDFRLLRENAERNAWNVDAIQDVFKLEHLSIPHDFAKIDCEGGEEILLAYNHSLGPCVIESHTAEITRRLVEKFRFSKTVTPRGEKSESRLLLNFE